MNQLLQLITSFNDKPVIYFPNPGNAGDSLIEVATIDFFRQHSIPFKISTNFHDAHKDSVLIHGGGGSFFADNGNVPISFLKINSEKNLNNTVIFLPQTYLGNEAFFSSLKDNVHLFSREQTSHTFLQNSNTQANLYLSHDMVFFLDIQQWMNQFSSNRLLLASPSRALKAVRRYSTCKKIAGESKTLYVIRTDKEKKSHEWDEDIHPVDISRAFSMGTKREAYANCAAWYFLKFIDDYDTVKTDRLHVGIAATMLGKRTYLYSNSYFKTSAIFNHSIKNNFNNCILVDN